MSKQIKLRKVKYVYSDVVSLMNSYASPPRRSASEAGKKKEVLEIGCGTGNNLVFLAEQGYKTCGIDMDERAVKFAGNLLRSKRLKANVQVGDATRLPYKDKQFDVVLDRACMQHNRIAKTRKIMKEVERVLKPGGLLIIVNFRSDYGAKTKNYKKNKTIQNYEYLHLISAKDLRALLKNFQVLFLEHTKHEVVVPEKQTKGTFNVVAKKL